MTLATLIQMPPPGRAKAGRRPRLALVLMGGGARTAYQAGVLRGLDNLLRLQSSAQHRPFPFDVLVGTSAGALNASFLASVATEGLEAFEQLARFWGDLRSEAVYRLDVPQWVRFSRLLTAVKLWGQARQQGALLDTMPLVDTLHQAISLAGIEHSLASGALEAVAVTASSYTSGEHWTFCQTQDESLREPWHRPGRRGEFQALSIEHLTTRFGLLLKGYPDICWLLTHATIWLETLGPVLLLLPFNVGLQRLLAIIADPAAAVTQLESEVAILQKEVADAQAQAADVADSVATEAAWSSEPKSRRPSRNSLPVDAKLEMSCSFAAPPSMPKPCSAGSCQCQPPSPATRGARTPATDSFAPCCAPLAPPLPSSLQKEAVSTKNCPGEGSAEAGALMV